MTADLIHRLLVVLEVEERVYLEFREVLQQERALMVALDARGLGDLAARKESLVDEGRLAEESRIEVASALSAALDIPDAPATLSRICQALGDEGTPLRDAHGRLVALIGAITELVEANRILGGDRLTYVETTLELLGRLVPHSGSEAQVYPRAATGAPGTGSGRILRRSA